MIKLLIFCFVLLLAVNVQADTTDSKWKNIIELKKALRFLFESCSFSHVLKRLNFGISASS